MIYAVAIAMLLLGGGIGWLAGLLAERAKRAPLEQERAQLEATLTAQQQAAADQLATQQRTAAEQLAAQKERYEEALAVHQRAAAEQLAAERQHSGEVLRQQQQHYENAQKQQKESFEETLQRVTAEVKLSTDKMLKDRQKEFAESSVQNITGIVNPLRESLERMMKQGELTMHSTDELLRVLSHGSKVQGDWGETILDELLESQGLKRGIHYDTQTALRDASGQTVRSEEGATLRPDVILHLDQEREVIIDCKVSLTAFINYVNAGTEAERQQYLKAHVESLEKHVRSLSKKDYSNYVKPPKVRMNYVIMFVPHTGALWTAMNEKPDLWRRAMEQNVFIADEQTLYAALRIVALTWTQIEQSENQKRVFDLAGEMMDRVGQFVKRYEAVGRALDAAQKAYEDGQRKLEPSGQSILQTCGKLIKLGAKQSATNPLPQLENNET